MALNILGPAFATIASNAPYNPSSKKIKFSIVVLLDAMLVCYVVYYLRMNMEAFNFKIMASLTLTERFHDSCVPSILVKYKLFAALGSNFLNKLFSLTYESYHARRYITQVYV